MSGPWLYLQSIRTEWSKKSRGAPEATQRNATPDVLPVDGSPVPVDEATVSIHQVRFIEPAFLSPVSRVHTSVNANQVLEMLRISMVWEGSLEVLFHGGLWGDNLSPPKRLFSLSVGEWRQFVTNWRETAFDSGDWLYRKQVLNIAPWNTHDDRVFLDRKETHRVADLHQLL